MDDLSVDQNKLPGVKEVCRDFAVLEDHCLAHNLQEQEIESHLASNIHKNRLVQQDLRVAKRLQEEEDHHAEVQHQKQHKDIERIDNEMAQEIQEQLVWQAEQQRKQEEKDEAIARKLQEREMKEDRRRQKQLEEQNYEDQGAYQPLSDHVLYPGADNLPKCVGERYRDVFTFQSSDQRRMKFDQKRCLNIQGNNNKHPDVNCSLIVPVHYEIENMGSKEDQGRWHENHASEAKTSYLKKYLTERNPHVDEEYLHPWRGKKYQKLPYQNYLIPVKEQPCLDDLSFRDNDRDRKRDVGQKFEREERINGVTAHYQDEDISRDRRRLKNLDQDTGQSVFVPKNRDCTLEKDSHGRKEREKDKRKHWSRDRSQGRDLDYKALPATIRQSGENTDYSSKQRLHFGYDDDVFEEPKLRCHSKSETPQYRGQNKPEEYKIRDAMQGLAQMDLRTQELRDMEVARRLQKEELKASRSDKRAAQVAQDEEIAWRLMEEEEQEYKRSREKEKQAMVRQQRRADGNLKPTEEDMSRPHTHEECDYQRARNPKPARLPPRTHNYDNVDSGYGYTDNYSPGPLNKPEAAYKGAYYRQ